MDKTYFTHSPEETGEIGVQLGKTLCGNETIALFGDLGAGKTAFTRGLAEGLGAAPEEVSSPTFAIMHEHEGRCRLCHYDMYRVETWEDLESTGFFESIGDAVNVIEWSENIENALPYPRWEITVSRADGENERRIDMRYIGSEEEDR